MESKYSSWKLVSVVSWREWDVGWSWHSMHTLEPNIIFEESKLTPRTILRYLRKWGFLTQESKGKLRVDIQDSIIKIQIKSTYEPILALILEAEV
jgi:hypothetical protein